MTYWLIEIAGPAWIGAQNLGGYQWFWTDDPNRAIRFYTFGQAEQVMHTIREHQPDLFPSCLPKGWKPTEHKWLETEPADA